MPVHSPIHCAGVFENIWNGIGNGNGIGFRVECVVSVDRELQVDEVKIRFYGDGAADKSSNSSLQVATRASSALAFILLV
jgi:hypothetical protein